MTKKVKRRTTILTGNSALETESEKLAQIQHNIEEIKALLLAERQAGIPNEQELQELIKAKQKEIDLIQLEIDKAKSLAKRRKQEIDDWKQWFHTLSNIDRTTEHEKLTVEINWRGTEINVKQDEISILEGKKWATKGELERLKQQLFALEAGVYDRPIEEDPRLVYALSLYKEIDL